MSAMIMMADAALERERGKQRPIRFLQSITT